MSKVTKWDPYNEDSPYANTYGAIPDNLIVSTIAYPFFGKIAGPLNLWCEYCGTKSSNEFKCPNCGAPK